MQTKLPIKIIGSGYYLPAEVLSETLEAQINMPSGWSARYSGVEKRHHVTHEINGFMGARAVEKALKNAGKEVSDIDLLISASATFDYSIPNLASVIKNEIEDGKNHDFSTLSIDTTCLSFVSAFELAASLLYTKKHRNIVIVSSEISSKSLNAENWETFTLFGDAAAAVVVEYDESSESFMIKSKQKTYSEGLMDTVMKGGGNAFHFKDFGYSTDLHTFAMNGKNLLRLAKRKVPEFVESFFTDTAYSMSNVDVIIPHQASKAGILMFQQMFNIEPERLINLLPSHGNCIAASIPLALCKAIESKKLQRGNSCLFIGTSAGFSIGACLFTY